LKTAGKLILKTRNKKLTRGNELRKTTVLIVVIVISLFSLQNNQDQIIGKVITSDPSWVQSSPLVENDTGYAHVYNDKIYFVGGYNIQVYNPEEGIWTIINEYGLGYQPFRGDSALIGDKIYILHGWTSDETIVYDITTNSISTLSHPPINRIDVAVAAVNGVLYVSGGWLSGDSTSITTVEAYNPNTGTWWQVSPMKTSRKQHEMVGTGNYLYAIGGLTGSGFFTMTKSVERYNSITDEWEYREPTDYNYHQCGSTITGKNQLIVSNVEHTSIYNDSSNTWNSWESLQDGAIVPIDPDYRAGYFANSIVVFNKTVFSIGLRDAPSNYYNYVWTLDLPQSTTSVEITDPSQSTPTVEISDPSQSTPTIEITESFSIFFLLFDMLMVVILVKKSRGKSNHRRY
jgi:hypothetical protein